MSGIEEALNAKRESMAWREVEPTISEVIEELRDFEEYARSHNIPSYQWAKVQIARKRLEDKVSHVDSTGESQ